MKHAGEAALDALESVLRRVRRLKGVRERKRGAFYRKGAGLLHFHEDPAGLFADLKINGAWKRFPINTTAQRRALLKKLK